MQIAIETGGYDIISHGTVIGMPNAPITFKIADLTVHISFVNDNNIRGQQIRVAPTSTPLEITLELVNQSNTLGVGNTIPIPIGTVNFKKLLLNYRLYTLNQSTSPMFHYSWLLSKQFTAENGQAGQ